MSYQYAKLPEGARKVGTTQTMTEETVLPGLLKQHQTPKNKLGFLVVEEGSLQFVWEDDEENWLTADGEHPIVIFPERLHHVVITGPVRFHVEFYTISG